MRYTTVVVEPAEALARANQTIEAIELARTKACEDYIKMRIEEHAKTANAWWRFFIPFTPLTRDAIIDEEWDDMFSDYFMMEHVRYSVPYDLAHEMLRAANNNKSITMDLRDYDMICSWSGK